VAVIALALGIGVNTSIFSLYNALALRPLPVKDPERVVRLFQTHSGESGAGVFSYPQFVDYRDRNSVLSGLAAWSWASAAMGSGDRVEDVKAMFVSGNYFDVLGADTAAGRTFVPEEDRTPDSHPVVILSCGFWERRFARDPALVGRTILLNGNPFTVVGVAARNFAGTDAEAPEIWLPIMMTATIAPERGTGVFQDRNGHWLQVIGRLKPARRELGASEGRDGRSVGATGSDLCRGQELRRFTGCGNISAAECREGLDAYCRPGNGRGRHGAADRVRERR
jgi:hypothetical protein